jgi:hypothetical protein
LEKKNEREEEALGRKEDWSRIDGGNEGKEAGKKKES